MQQFRVCYKSAVVTPFFSNSLPFTRSPNRQPFPPELLPSVTKDAAPSVADEGSAIKFFILEEFKYCFYKEILLQIYGVYKEYF